MSDIQNFKSFRRAQKHFGVQFQRQEKIWGSKNTRNLHPQARIQITVAQTVKSNKIPLS